MIDVIDQEIALQFLRDNHATREVIFIRPCDEWIAFYDGDIVAGVTGINYKRGGVMSVDCTFVRSDYRGRGILKEFYARIMAMFPDSDFVIYCRPIAAHVVKKYYGFEVTQKFDNGTEKCVLRRKENGKTKD